LTDTTAARGRGTAAPGGTAAPADAPRPPPDAPAGALPRPLTSFVGREPELAITTEHLRDPAVRLLSLTGPGGVGKTRLALEAARGVGDAFPDGVVFVPLAPLADPALVPVAVAQALGVHETANRPTLHLVQAALREARLLLVLDNCEHLAAACAGLADPLLRACPRLTVLATSRAPLGLDGEVAWRVPPLAVPADPGGPGGPGAAAAVARHDAVRLFAARARTALPAFAVTERNAATVARLCRRLDGVPLALELAAARVRVLTVDELLRRLDDRFRLLTGGGRTAPPRHQTLRALVAWSHDLLDEPDRRLFARLGVFAGAFTLEAAERVGAGAGVDAGDVLDGLTRLVDQSLVQPEPGPDGVGRYRLLETLRHFARERLAAAGEAAAVARRHAEHLVALAEAAAPALLGPEQVAWLDRLESELDDVRAALRWCADRGEAELGLRLAGALRTFWHVRWYRSEGRRWLETVLALPDPEAAAADAPGAAAAAAGLRAARMEAHLTAGLLAWVWIDLDAAAEHNAAALTLAEALGDGGGIARARSGLGMVALRRDDLAAARPLLSDALARFRALGDGWGTALGLEQLGALELADGNPGAARRALEESVAVQRRVGDRALLQSALSLLGEASLLAGDRAEARRRWEEAVAAANDLGYRGSLVTALCHLGTLAQADGDPGTARRRLEAALEAARRGARELVPYVLDRLAGLALFEGRPAHALRLFGAAAGLRRASGWTEGPRWGRAAARARRDADIAAARAALPGAEAARIWDRAEGQDTSLDEAVSLARREVAGAPESPPAGAAPGGPDRTALPRGLTNREAEVLRHVAAGETDRQIAAALLVTEATVGRHLANIYAKLGVASRAAATAFALRAGIA
jgi:non-specific serine/threonine protein kinase